MVQQRTPSQSWFKMFRKISPQACVAVLLAGLIAGCTEPPVFHRNPVALLPMGALSRDWYVDLHLSQSRILKVDVRDKLVYLYLSDKLVLGFDRKAGTLQMSMQVNGAPTPSYLMPLVELRRIGLRLPQSNFARRYLTEKGMFDRSIPLRVDRFAAMPPVTKATMFISVPSVPAVDWSNHTT